MNCNNCDQKLNGDEKFCSKCGSRVEINVNNGKPLLENEVLVKFKKIGYPQKSFIKLFDDKLEIVNKKGESLGLIELNKIINAGTLAGGVIYLETNNLYCNIQFTSIARQIGFGLIGYLTDPNRGVAQVWKKALENKGVNFN